MASFWDKGLGGDYAGGTYVDPAGLFKEGGLLGPPDTSAQDAQAGFLKQMMGREGELYPEIKDLLTKAGTMSDQQYKDAVTEASKKYPELQGNLSALIAPGGLYDQAKNAQVGEVNKVYPGVQSDIATSTDLAKNAAAARTGEVNKLYPGVQNDINAAGANAESFNLPPAALDALNKIRQERIDSIGGDVNNLIGSKVADYARRGVLSSSTAEGMGGEVTKAIAPTINQAEQDYQQARLALPSQLYQIAKDRGLTTYGLGQTQGAINADSLTGLSNVTKDNALTSFGVAKDYGAVNADAISKAAGNIADISKTQYGAAVGQGGLLSDAMSKKRQDLINPYLDMWKTSAGIGATPPSQAPQNTAGASAVGSIVGAMVSKK